MINTVGAGDYVEIVHDVTNEYLGRVARVHYAWTIPAISTEFAQCRLATNIFNIFRGEQFRKLMPGAESDAALIAAWKLLNES